LNKIGLFSLFLVLILIFGFVTQKDIEYTFGQNMEPTTKNDTDTTRPINDTLVLDTKSNFQSPVLPDLKNYSVKTVTYTPKFLCGNVSSNEGPVRPGHYDTDISILNKQDYPIKIFWNVIPNDGNSSNSIIKILKPESSTGITCKDILPLVTISKNLLEGFVLLALPISDGMISAFPDPNNPQVSILRSVNEQQTNLIDVQVFYTANALPQLPSEMLFSKVDFRILNDSSGKIPKALLGQVLEVSLISSTNQIYDQLSRINSVLKERFGLSDSEINSTSIKIEDSSIDALFPPDDHAISSSRLSPNIYLK
jgi:hypothetical protein